MTHHEVALDKGKLAEALTNENDVGFIVEMQIHDGRVVGLEVKERDWERSILADDRQWLDDVEPDAVARLIVALAAETKGKSW